MATSIQEKSINTIRLLAADAIQKAKSGHPGMPMGMAPLAYLLYSKIMKHNPKNPKFLNRDRFILSGGHGSMLLYSILHLSGYKITLNDLKNFRQWKSITPGHPEFGLTAGVETTTGPLGQGFTNAVGMAVAQEHLASRFNKKGYKILDHYIYVEAGDGDLMEGLSHEAASFAGHNKLGKLIVFYDDNGISIDGPTTLSYSDNVPKRFESYNWHVQKVNDINDLKSLEKAIKVAQKEKDKPSIIITKTTIGFGSPNKKGTSEIHGAPLGEDELILTKRNLGFPEDKKFVVTKDVYKHFSTLKEKGKKEEDKWNKLFKEYKIKYPSEAKLFKQMMDGKIGNSWKKKLPKFESYGESLATRSASGKVLNAIVSEIPSLFGGSADLTPSNNTELKGYNDFSPVTPDGRYVRYGVREHAMAGLMNGIAIYGGLIPYGGTFMVFSDYLRPSIRLASISKIKPIYVFTHDSIGVGEDGPTHQPIEQIASLRSIPGCIVIRPSDANETSEAWKFAIEHKGSPVALGLTRQNLKIVDRNVLGAAEGVSKGAYILKDSKEKLQTIIMASGSEVDLALKSAEELEKEGINCRVVSFPSWEIFEMQSEEYKESVLPKSVRARIAIEAGVSQGWFKYVGLDGKTITIDEKYGSSAPQNIVFEKYGFTVENIVKVTKSVL
ncbi:MAG: transketolase [Ignavibacteriales bacterium]|nr:transketolase [Ignavibacteriales bacterium]MCB9218609.1 transketolase [Ignavibacteriales bacterium]